MGKIPSVDIIRETYAYVLRNFTALVGLVWLPTMFYAASYYAPRFLDITVQTLVASIISVAVARRVLENSSTKVFVHFSFASAEWRMFRSSIVVVAMMALAILLFVVISVLAYVGLGYRLGGTFPVMLFVPLFAFIFVTIAFMNVRYLFYLPLSAIASPNGWLRRSHALSEGNFWAIFAILVGISLPSIGILLLVLGFDWTSGALHSPASLREFTEMMRQLTPKAVGLNGHGLIGAAINACSSTLFQVLSVTAAAIAYRGREPLATDAAEVFA